MEFLHFYIKEGTATLTPTYRITYASLYYSYNKTDWTTVQINESIELVPDKKVYFKGVISGTNTDGKIINFKASGSPLYAGGSIMSLQDGNPDETTIKYPYEFKFLFLGCNTLVTPPELPATTLSDSCYYFIFSNCTSLTTAPELPAKTLSDSCYRGMFNDCTSLVKATELPVTTLTNYCYQDMFSNCTSLINAPALPATTLTGYCYANMFYNCTSLVTAPELPATTLANNCYEYMFNYCESLVTAPELPATTLAPSCCEYMFDGCTSLVKAPVLLSIEPKYRCYKGMFNGCSKLNYVKCLLKPDKPDTNECLTNWMNGVASNGTFVKNKDFDNWERSGNGIPTSWNVKNDGEEIFTITVTSNDTEHCRVFGNGQYIYESIAIIKCVPLSGYEFVQWNDGNTDATREVTVTSDATFTATIRKLPTVTLNGDNCTLTGSGTYSYGANVEISCVPNDLYEFVRWSDGNTNAIRIITVTEDITLTAVTRAITSQTLQITVRKGTDDFVRTVIWYLDYKGGTFSWDAKVETDFDNLTTNVEISDDRVTNISKGSSWIGDSRIYSYNMTVPRNDSDTNKEFTINITSTNGILSDSITVRVVQRPKLPVLIEDIFVSSGDVENVLVTIPDTMGEVWVVYEDETLAKYTIDDCVSNYVLYYRNALGGIDLFPVTGKVIKSNDIEHLTINKKYDNRTLNFGKTNYENVLTERWQLYSGRLTDQQSKLMHHLINSTYVYLYDIQADKFTPVVITDTEMEYKTYKNNNNKMVYYTINVEASQTKYRR